MQDGKIAVRMDGREARSVRFDPREFRQFDHGYAVTSHSSQGLTAGRVLAHIDTDSVRGLISDRLAYVAISRASNDARIYTNNAETLGDKLATDITKTAAVAISEHGVGSRSVESIAKGIGATTVPVARAPEIDLESFGLGR
jgi:ATP-dependent exoDNAse (exonuclease V) alpha subunit